VCARVDGHQRGAGVEELHRGCLVTFNPLSSDTKDKCKPDPGASPDSLLSSGTSLREKRNSVGSTAAMLLFACNVSGGIHGRVRVVVAVRVAVACSAVT
jgi:hypothetical protein